MAKNATSLWQEPRLFVLFFRKKREVCQDLVAKGTQERQRLIEIFEKRKTDLEKQYDAVRQKFTEEKAKVGPINLSHPFRFREI